MNTNINFSKLKQDNGRPLNILYVVDGFFPSVGGAEMQAAMLSKALLENGHKINIITPRLDHSKPLNEMFDGIPVKRIDYPKIKILGAAILCIKFASHIIKNKNTYDAIHVHITKNLATVLGFLSPFIKATTISKVSGAGEFEGGILDPKYINHPVFKLYNTMVKRLSHIQCISEYTKDQLIKNGYKNSMLAMVPNAVDVDRFKIKNHDKTKTSTLKIIYIGRLRPVKGINILIDAWNIVIKKFKSQQIELILAGDGYLREQLEDQVSKLGLNDSVSFTGKINNVPELLNSSDIYVQPSFQEGLPNSVLEAMAVGLPIIATKVSGNEDIVQHKGNGYLVNPGDSSKIAEFIHELIKDKNKRIEMGNKSREIIMNNYQAPVVVNRLMKLYQG